ncbi:MAG: SH3 domain-containing protein [Pseudomonadota bacterium]
MESFVPEKPPAFQRGGHSARAACGAKCPNVPVAPETFDLPGTGVTGPAYRLRNVPANRELRIRTGPDRSTQVAGQMPAAEQDILVLSCTPQIDPVRYDQTSHEGKHEMLGGAWCQIETRSGLRGYVLGRYLDPNL